MNSASRMRLDLGTGAELGMEREHRWSIMVARLGGVSIRVHLFFWILAASTLYLAWTRRHSDANQADLFLIASLSLFGLAVSVLLHELAHWFAARKAGGVMPTLVIGPISGMGTIWGPDDPRRQIFVLLAGPAANLLIALFSLVALFLINRPRAGWLQAIDSEQWMLDPLSTPLQLAVLINGLLGVINLFPSLLLDGGKALRAALLWKWPRLGRHQAERWVAAATRIVSATLLLFVVLSWHRGWAIDEFLAPLTLFSLFLFFSSENHEPSPQPMSPAVGAGTGRGPLHESAVEATLRQLKQAPPKLPSSPRARPRQDLWDPNGSPTWGAQGLSPESSPAPNQQQDAALLTSLENYLLDEEANEERRMDELLMRVHQEGMQSLSPDEHALLQRVSARYRERRQRLAPR